MLGPSLRMKNKMRLPLPPGLLDDAISTNISCTVSIMVQLIIMCNGANSINMHKSILLTSCTAI